MSTVSQYAKQQEAAAVQSTRGEYRTLVHAIASGHQEDREKLIARVASVGASIGKSAEQIDADIAVVKRVAELIPQARDAKAQVAEFNSRAIDHSRRVRQHWKEFDEFIDKHTAAIEALEAEGKEIDAEHKSRVMPTERPIIEMAALQKQHADLFEISTIAGGEKLPATKNVFLLRKTTANRNAFGDRSNDVIFVEDLFQFMGNTGGIAAGAVQAMQRKISLTVFARHADQSEEEFILLRAFVDRFLKIRESQTVPVVMISTGRAPDDEYAQLHHVRIKDLNGVLQSEADPKQYSVLEFDWTTSGAIAPKTDRNFQQEVVLPLPWQTKAEMQDLYMRLSKVREKALAHQPARV